MDHYPVIKAALAGKQVGEGANRPLETKALHLQIRSIFRCIGILLSLCSNIHPTLIVGKNKYSYWKISFVNLLGVSINRKRLNNAKNKKHNATNRITLLILIEFPRWFGIKNLKLGV